MFDHIIGIAFLALMVIPIAIVFIAFINQVKEDIKSVPSARSRRSVPVYQSHKAHDRIAEEYASKNIRIVK